MTLPKAENLDEWFPRSTNGSTAKTVSLLDEHSVRLGVVVGGSLSKGLVVRLERGQTVEDLAVGRYVVVHGERKRFFCMLTDIELSNTNPSIQNDPPDISDPFIRDVITGTAAYGTIHVAPMLSLEDDKPKPVKTIPGHFTHVYNATEQDVNDVFGQEDATHFNVGAPLELEHTQINLDLKRLVERSIGVFGKSGTGKSFLTRVLLSGVISRGMACSLIFDMHNDYGWEVTDERGPKAKGLAQLFPGKVTILTLDAESSRRRNARYDSEVRLGYDEIEPEDIAMLKSTMSLSDAMIDAAFALRKRWGEEWISRLLKGSVDDFDELTENTPILGGTLTALQRRLERFQRWEFLIPKGTGESVERIIHLLVEEQKSVVLEFGRYGNSLEAYILVANYLTRRIHERYVEKVEKALGDSSMEPPQLLITIEEAHKFLDPQIARQTIFGIIAREMRKYKVTLLVVDQRPSGIDEEVISQIGTRVTALLDNERDIQAVLTGISGAGGLREVLARLDTKQQAIIMGHAVPMPVVVRTRAYDDDFYKAVMNGTPVPNVPKEDARKSLGGSGKKRI
ncbi:MAG: ATP-binding protein [bacterium]|nr:ATP-binding protein [bacterium]